MRLRQLPYNLLFLAGILFFITGLFNWGAAINIQWDDTYFIFPLTYFIWVPAAILFLFWGLYLAIQNRLFSKAFSWTHIILTIASCIFMVTIPYFITNTYEGLAGMPRRYYDIGQSKTYMFYHTSTKATVCIIFFLAAGQLVFLVNFFMGLYRRLKEQSNR